MTSLTPHRFDGTPSEALSYLHDTGSDVLSTPSPAVHLAGATAIAAVGAWAAIAVGLDHPLVGTAVGLVAVTLALIDLLPAVWTLSHREYATRYLAARMTYGDAQARIHPFIVLLGFPVLCFVAMALGGPPGDPVVWGLIGAAGGLALGLVRVHHARSTIGASDGAARRGSGSDVTRTR